jgi:hypothetical protein
MKNKNTFLIEAIMYGVAGGNTQMRLQLLDQPYLRGAHIWSIEAFNVVDIAKSPQGNVLVPAATLQNSFLTLYTTDASNIKGPGEYLNNIPLSCLKTLNNFADPYEFEPFELSGQIISWDKSYITLGAPIGNTVNNSFLFNIGFTFSSNNNTN